MQNENFDQSKKAINLLILETQLRQSRSKCHLTTSRR